MAETIDHTKQAATAEGVETNDTLNAQTTILEFMRLSLDKVDELVELQKITNIHLALITGEEIISTKNT